jgi:micrococcal nuclease
VYEYKAIVLKVHDGDTIKVNADLGFNVSLVLNIRLRGINAPELRGTDLESGLASKDWLKDQLPVGKDVIIKTHLDKKEKYGRYLADIYIDEFKNESLNDALVRLGHAIYVDYD